MPAPDMPEDQPRAATPRQVALAWLVMILLVGGGDLLAEGAKRRQALVRPSRIVTRWQRAAQDGPAYDCVVLGDSSVESSVDPQLLGSLLGGTATSYPAPSGQPWLDAWVLQQHLEHHGAPKAVVLAHVYDVWPRGAAVLTMSRVPLPWGFWRRLRPAVRLSAGQTVEMALARYCALYSERNLWRERAMDVPKRLVRRLLGSRQTAAAVPRKQTEDQGFYPMRSQDAAELGRDYYNHLAVLRGKRLDYDVAELNLRAVREMAALSQRWGFTLYVTPGAIHEELAREPGYQAVQDKLAQAVTEAGRDGRVRYLRRMWPGIPVAELGNTVDHTQAAGAERYTRALAAAIRAAGP